MEQIELFKAEDHECKKKVSLFAVMRHSPLRNNGDGTMKVEPKYDYQLIIVDPYMTMNLSLTPELLINLQHAIQHALKQSNNF